MYGIDIIKSLAVFFVVGVHFFLHTAYYQTPLAGGNMFLQTAVRDLFLTCVPLFLLCTGYLDRKKTVSFAYYRKLLRVLVPYALISVISICFRMTQGEQFYLRKGLKEILHFSANGYAWYVNMFIGLYLLIPLLNGAVQALRRKQLLAVIGTLIVLISLPPVVNPVAFRLGKLSFIMFPDWWMIFYPVLYYLIGAYFSAYLIRIPKPICLAAIPAIPITLALVQMYFGTMQQDNWFLSDYGSLPYLAESLAIFLLFYDLDIKNGAIRKISSFLSNLTLEIFLFSYITDQWLYARLKAYIAQSGELTQVQIFNRYFPVIVPLSFLGSVLLAALFGALYRLARKGVNTVLHRTN